MNQDELQLAAGMQAFGKLYDAIEPKLQEAAIRMLRDACEVAEFMQDCRATLLIEAQKFDPTRSRFCQWAERTVVNLCRCRREQLDKEISLSGIANELDERNLIADAEMRVDYEMAIAKLPPMQKKCWEMRQEGYTGGEIATMLGISRDAVDQNICRGRQQIKEYMSV